MMVMIDAAPGLVPHSAVVPGSSFRRVISQPKRLLAATTNSTPALNSIQCPRMSPVMVSGTILAIRQPITPCASTKADTGKRTRRPRAARIMAALSGPSIRAAGACSQSSNAAMAADRAMSSAHCRAGASHVIALLGELLRLALHPSNGVEKLGHGRRDPSIIRSTQHQRYARAAVAEGGVTADVEVLVALLQRAQRLGDDALGQVGAHGARMHRIAAHQPVSHRLEHRLGDLRDA